MGLIFRQPRVEDFTIVYDELRPGGEYSKPSQEQSEAVWTALLDNPASLAKVLEDDTRPERQRIRGYWRAVLLTKEFADWAKTEGPPHIQMQLAGTMPGRPRPLLTRDEVAAGNSGDGLILLTTEILLRPECWQPGYRGEESYQLHRQVPTFHAGYQIKELLHDSSFRAGHDQACKYGLHCVRDYTDYYGDHLPSSRPYLMNLNREEALNLARPNPSSHVFHYTAPQIFFSPGEQEVLLEALEGKTN